MIEVSLFALLKSRDLGIGSYLSDSPFSAYSKR